MKSVLILLNLILAAYLGIAVIDHFRGDSDDSGGFTVKKSRNSGTGKNVTSSAPASGAAVSVDSLVATIIDNNIFNTDRCPNAQFGRGGSTRIEMTLVGTFQIGTLSGAVIKQKNASNNNRGMMGMMMGMGPGMAPPEGGPPGFGGPPGNNQGQNDGRNRRGATRSRFGTGNNTSGTNNGSGTTTTYKQYVRLGETLANGYTLVAVTRTGATLTRGSDKIELELEDPSKNLPSTSSANTGRNQRGSFMQMMQNMQNMQMMQNMRMMRMMERTMRNNGNQNRNSGNRGGPPGPGR